MLVQEHKQESISTGTHDALRRVLSLPQFPPEKPSHILYEAVYTPLPLFEGDLSTDGTATRWKSEREYVNVSSIKTRQKYIYPSKTAWYITHPVQIELEQLHKEKWTLASVFYVDGVFLLENGNHRAAAALLLGWERIKMQVLRRAQ